MTDRVQYLTFILVGLLCIAIGLFAQKNTTFRALEPFQLPPPPNTTSSLTSSEAVTSSPPSVALSTPPTDEAEKASLLRKVSEIRRAQSLIKLVKPKIDLTLNQMLDAESMSNLDRLYEEIEFYDMENASPEYTIFKETMDSFDTLDEQGKNTIRITVSVSHQISTMLEYIYLTLPATVASGDTAVNSDASSIDMITDPNVIKELKLSVQNVLSGMPKVTDKLTKIMNDLTTMTAQFTGANITDDKFLEKYSQTFITYYRLITARTEAMKSAMGKQRAAIQSSANVSTGMAPTASTVQQSAEALLKLTQSAIDFIAPIRQKIIAAGTKNPQNYGIANMQNVVETAHQQLTIQLSSLKMTTAVGAATMNALPVEAFATVSSSFSAPTPNQHQTVNFKLGKQGLIDAVKHIELS